MITLVAFCFLMELSNTALFVSPHHAIGLKPILHFLARTSQFSNVVSETGNRLVRVEF